MSIIKNAIENVPYPSLAIQKSVRLQIFDLNEICGYSNVYD